MKSLKTFLLYSIFLLSASCLFLISSPAAAHAKSNFQIQDGVLQAYNGNEKHVIIPDTVTTIGAAAFCDKNNIQSITVPSSVKEIKSYAFSLCASLKTVTLNEGLLTLGDNAFDSCSSLTEAILPDSITSLGNAVFFQCSALQTVKLPAGITQLNDYLFYGCTSLRHITFPEYVRSVGEYAIDSTQWYDDELQNSNYLIIGDAFVSGRKIKGSFTIPSNIKTISSLAFYGNSNIKNVTIPDGCTSIGENAFLDCSKLTTILFPSSIQEIGNSAFYNTPWLKAQKKENPLVIVNNLLIDGNSASGSIVVPDGVTELLPYAFQENKTMKSLTLPASLLTLKCTDLVGCSKLASITISKKITSIDANAFVNSSSTLKKIVLKRGTKFQVNQFSNEELGQDVWTSSNPSILKISSTGNVTAAKKGSCTLTVLGPEDVRTYNISVK